MLDVQATDVVGVDRVGDEADVADLARLAAVAGVTGVADAGDVTDADDVTDWADVTDVADATGVADVTDLSRVLGLVAASLDYPDGSFFGFSASDREQVERMDPEMAAALRRLAGWLSLAAPGGAAERYSSLFDLRPVCTLHVGYHLFGEAYQRGALLSGLVAEMRTAGVPLAEQLPDYLPCVLRLLAALPPGDDRESLVDALLLPALSRMTEAMKGVESPWSDVLRALPAFLAPLGGGAPLPAPERVTDIDLEADAHA